MTVTATLLQEECGEANEHKMDEEEESDELTEDEDETEAEEKTSSSSPSPASSSSASSSKPVVRNDSIDHNAINKKFLEAYIKTNEIKKGYKWTGDKRIALVSAAVNAQCDATEKDMIM